MPEAKMAATATQVKLPQEPNSSNHHGAKQEPGTAWKSKLDLPEKDRRVKTEVNIVCESIALPSMSV